MDEWGIMQGFHAGSAPRDARGHRGWIVGWFMPPGLAKTDAVEVKWGQHARGEQRAEWTADDTRTALCVLVEGRFRVETTVGTAVLAAPGDYVMWGPGVDHWWVAEEASTVMTVRWPSDSGS